MKKVPIFVLALVLLIVGIVLVIVGGVLIPHFNEEIRKIAQQRAKLTNKSEVFANWYNGTDRKPDTVSIFVYNITNPTKVDNLTVEEVGPFVYSVKETKRGVRFDNGGTSLTYERYRKYAERKPKDDVDVKEKNVTVVNLHILSLITRLRSEKNQTIRNRTIQMLANSSENIFTTISVDELLWGYKNPTFDEINNYTHYFKDTTIGVLHQSGSPSKSRSSKSYNVLTGSDDVSTTWNIKTWNNMPKLRYWKTKQSNAINGTDGYAWHPYVTSSDRLYRFDPDWFRSVYLTHENQTKSGNLTSDRFSVPRSVFDTSLPENKGFCQPTPDHTTSCLGAGFLNITSCSEDKIPWILSQPHFFDSNDSRTKRIKGIKSPNKASDGNWIDLELLTGEVIEAKNRKQFNVFLTNDSKIFNQTRQFQPSIIVPVAYVDEMSEMSDNERHRIQRLHEDIEHQRGVYERIEFSLIGVGLFLIVLAVVVFIIALIYFKIKAEPERQPLLGDR